MRDPAIEQRLRHTPLFSTLSDDLYQRFFEGAEIINFRLGAKICQTPEPSQGLFILLSGKVRALTNERGQQEVTLFTLTRPGDYFGEECLDGGTPSPYTVRASGETVIIRASTDAVHQIASVSHSFRDKLEQSRALARLCSLFKTSPALGRLTYGDIQGLLLRCRVLSAKAGESVPFAVGAIDGLCLVAAGEVEILDGEPAVRRPVKPGEFFGLALLNRSEPGNESAALCLVDSKLLVLSKEAYDALEHRDASLAYNLKSVLYPGEFDESPLLEPDWTSPDSLLKASAFPLEEDLEFLPGEGLARRFRRAFHKYPFKLQQSEMDCGAACLAMVCSFYGKNINMNYIRDLADVGRHGTDMLSLAEAAETLGFVSRGLQATYAGLEQLKLPIICHWEGNHYVTLYETNADFAIVGDPAREVLKVEREEFAKSFTGFALELTPTRKLGAGAAPRTSFGRFLPFLAPHWKVLAEILLASFVIQVLMLASPIFTQVIVDKVLIHQSVSMLNIMLLGMVLVTVFQTLVSTLRAYFMAFTAMKLDQSMFVEFFRHTLSLPLRYFEQRNIGDIVARFGENAKIRGLLTGAGLNVLLDVLMIAVYLGLIFYYNALFGLCVVGYLALYAILAVTVTPILKSISRRAFEKEAAQSSFLIESLRGIEKVKSSAAERRIRWKWEELFVDSLNVRFQGALTRRAVEVVSGFLGLGGSVLLLWFGARLVIDEVLSIGQLMALNMMVSRVSGPVGSLIGMWDQFQEVTISFERLGDVLDAEPEEPEPAKKLVLPGVAGSIKFDSVTFRYSATGNTNALQNVTFEAAPGQFIAIVGRSGSGKSTLLRLIQGLYVPTEGRVFVDGHDIQYLSLPHLRSQIGVVSQQEYLFKGTVRETIAFNKPEASTEAIIKAATWAGIDDYISTMPAGYETILSEAGSNLSGGQRQRLAIARALLAEPRILLLDEPTSFLDAESERRIQDSMSRIRHDRTVFVVAHRISTIKDADLILVMDDGAIVERGTHESLMAERGLYYYLTSQQVNV